MKDNVSKFSNPVHVVDYPIAWTFSPGKACMMLPRHGRFICCEIDTACYNQSYTTVVYTFSRNVQNVDLNITRSEEVVEAAKLFVKAMDGLAAKTKMMIWEVPPGLSQKQSFPSRITHILLNHFKDSSLSEMPRAIPLSRPSAKWNAMFHTINSGTLLAVDSAATEVLNKKS